VKNRGVLASVAAGGDADKMNLQVADVTGRKANPPAGKNLEKYPD